MNRLVVTFVAIFAVVFSFGIPSYADTSYGNTWFATEDGKWDKTIATTTTDTNVRITLGDLWRVNKSTGERIYYASDFLPLDGRLCSASTGNCTSYKSFNDPTFGYIPFTNMKPGTYYLDVIDYETGYTYEGYVSALVY
ncbi:hypothetical protein GCM10011571_10050 [Marinithermofilum abyssi]|uniref:Uncharacterized protein n=1 Tax=Marinithermofilum abyssi TaxID=1571185 RepID=A0A8J2YAC2_9BACL|nr:hypothetical protein [Marinithermofilum abyssi]GGE10724.1 hypothetical protein GCM10011571_10050 [Marinithermofilum abyssi]